MRPGPLSRTGRVVAALVMLVVVIAACGRGEEPTPALAPVSAVEDAVAAVPPTPVPSTPTPTLETSSTPEPTATPEASPTAQPSPTAIPQTSTGAQGLVTDDFAALQGMRVGLITHRASQVDGQRLADLMDQSPAVDLVALFAPEHGIDGTAAAGASVSDAVDATTGVPIFSLYGLDRSPNDGTLVGVDVLVYDLQDVGSRFFTYISTLGLSMQAASQAGIPFVVLDRPNPLGGTLQGPTLAPGTRSFIGLYPIPNNYGLTSGELALLIKDQAWLDGLVDLDLRIVELEHWERGQTWDGTGLEWIAPSPNLASFEAAVVYPGTVLFEATSISEGRGTNEPFLTIAAPWIDGQALADDMNARQLPGVSFEATSVVPQSVPLAAPNPRYLGERIYGVRIEVTDPAAAVGFSIGLHLLDAILRQGEGIGLTPSQIIDRPDIFDLLAGDSSIRVGLTERRPVQDILASTMVDHAAFSALVDDILLYD